MKEVQTVSVQVVAADELVPYDKNARVHSAEQIEQINASIREFGFTNPILADGDEIVAGHGRRAAVLSLYAAGETVYLPGGRALPAGTVPVIDCSGWTEAQRRAYVLADNKLAENATWDEDLLKLELAFLDGANFDLGLTGFDTAALDAALGRGAGAADPAPDPLRVSLADRFGIPPFSVLNAREGWWQDRKAAWLALGITSEVGRGENLLKFSDTLNEPDRAKGGVRPLTNGTFSRHGTIEGSWGRGRGLSFVQQSPTRSSVCKRCQAVRWPTAWAAYHFLRRIPPDSSAMGGRRSFRQKPREQWAR